MGLMFKFKKDQRDRWDLFFQRGLEFYSESKLIGMPFGVSGYGFAGNPFDAAVIHDYWKLLGKEMALKLVFLVDSVTTAENYFTLSTLAKQMGELFWPGDLVISIPAQFTPNLEKLFPTPLAWDTFQEIFQQSSVNLLVPNHPVPLAYLTFLGKNQRPTLMVGNFAGLEPGLNVVEPLVLSNEFGGDNIGVIFDANKTQNGKSLLPQTVVECMDEEIVSIIQEGLIPSDDILDFVENLRD